MCFPNVAYYEITGNAWNKFDFCAISQIYWIRITSVEAWEKAPHFPSNFDEHILGNTGLDNFKGPF